MHDTTGAAAPLRIEITRPSAMRVSPSRRDRIPLGCRNLGGTLSQVAALAMLGAILSVPHPARAQTPSGSVAMSPPSCETYNRERPRGGPFEQLSDLFGLSIYRWEEADFNRYRDFLLACGRSLPSLRNDVSSEAWDATVAQSVAGLKEYAGYGQGRPRTRLDPDTPDYTPTFRKMSCDRFTRASIEGSPFTVPVEYWNDEVWQALENRFLECERERGSPHANRTIVRLMIDPQRERHHWEIDRAQEPERNRKMTARAQEQQRKEAEELERSRREEQARSATDPCNRVEMRRRLMQAANGMDRARYGGRRLIDLMRGRSMGVEGAPGVSCMFLGQWSSGEQGLVTITVRKNSLGDDLIEVRP